MKQSKKQPDYGFFGEDTLLTKLSQLGDPLEKLKNKVDFEIFRPLLESGFEKTAKGKGGRPPFDYVMMFKILILQRYYDLSDDQIEYQINDRISFMRFLDLTLADKIPDGTTVWIFRQQLIDLMLIDTLFNLFFSELEKQGLTANEGETIDINFVKIPKQRNAGEEK